MRISMPLMIFSDQSIVKSILAFLSNNSSDQNVLVHGMATILLGSLLRIFIQRFTITKIRFTCFIGEKFRERQLLFES